MDRYKTSNLMRVLFAIYLLVLFWILQLKLGVRFSYMENRVVNLVPFREPLSNMGRVDVSEIILNVVIFVPLGIYAEVLFQRWTFWRKLLCFFLTSLTFEFLQLVFRTGAFDITDIIANTLGAVLGLMAFEGIEMVFNSRAKTQQFIRIIATIGTVLMVSFLLLLKLNMLPILYR